MDDNGAGQWVTLDAAVRTTGKSARTIRRWVAKDKMPHKHEEGRLWVDLSGLDLTSGQVDSDNGQAVSDNDTGDDSDGDQVKIARLEAELAGLNKLNGRLELELEAWKGQAAALTAALSDQRLIEAEASAAESDHHGRRWWRFWK